MKKAISDLYFNFNLIRSLRHFRTLNSFNYLSRRIRQFLKRNSRHSIEALIMFKTTLIHEHTTNIK